MIITVSGKPCSGKSTMAEIFCEKYKFHRIYAGAVFKEEARKMGMNMLELSSSDKCIEIDHRVDEYLKSIYDEHFNEDIIIESRTAFSFMPKAFNVFIDLDEKTMGERLFNSDRTGREKAESLEEAIRSTKERYEADRARYKKIYNIDVDDKKNYSLVFSNAKMTAEETADKIYKEYKKFLKNLK